VLKKLYILIVFFVVCNFLIFGSDNQWEEIDFILFLPNSSTQFENAEQSNSKLDNIAQNLLSRSLAPGQIHIYGYAAEVRNDIDPVELSRDRGLLIINELQKRGVSNDLFTVPQAHGSVDLWGSNFGEEGRRLNRRVVILLENVIPPPTVEEIVLVEAVEKESGSKFPWWLLFLLPLIAILFFLFRKKSSKEDTKEPIITSIPAKAKLAPPVPIINMNLDEEIRLCAYYHSLERGDWNKDSEQDWHIAVQKISAIHKAAGHSVYFEDCFWWASKKSDS